MSQNGFTESVIRQLAKDRVHAGPVGASFMDCFEDMAVAGIVCTSWVDRLIHLEVLFAELL